MDLSLRLLCQTHHIKINKFHLLMEARANNVETSRLLFRGISFKIWPFDNKLNEMQTVCVKLLWSDQWWMIWIRWWFYKSQSKFQLKFISLIIISSSVILLFNLFFQPHILSVHQWPTRIRLVLWIRNKALASLQGLKQITWNGNRIFRITKAVCGGLLGFFS